MKNGTGHPDARRRALHNLGVVNVEGLGDQANATPPEENPPEPEIQAEMARINGDYLAQGIKDECQNRIEEEANATGQVNLAVKRANGTLPAEEHATHDALISWVDQMQAKCRELITAGDTNYKDANWPPAPAGVGDLARKY